MARVSEHPNIIAFLDMLSWSEGTLGLGDDGYNVIVGGGLFARYADHPRQSIELPRLNIRSTAAGRYQLLSRYFDAYRTQLGLHDFSPVAQDMIAIQQIKECRAYQLIISGQITEAISRCARIWASLPGAGYGQREHKLADLLRMYVTFGGLRQ